MTPWLAVALAFGAAAVGGAVVGAVGWTLARRTRRLGVAVLVPPVAALAAVLASVAVSTRAMYLDARQTEVVLAACAGGAVVGLLAAVLLGRAVRRLEDGAASDRAARSAAETAERARRELLAAVTHDLRTPLAGISAMAQALEDGVADARDGYPGRIRAEADRTAAMVQEMFSLARLQAGLDREAPVLVDAVAVAREAVHQLSPLARAAGVALTGTGLDGAGLEGAGLDGAGRDGAGRDGAGRDGACAPVRAAPGTVQRVLANLVQNAVRETAAAGAARGPGGIEGSGGVVVGVRRDGPDVVLTVEDACGGIPAQDLPHLFEAGWRGARARTPDGSGAGLGLAVVAQLVDDAGGRVAVGPRPGGCCFSVRLPLAGGHEGHAPER